MRGRFDAAQEEDGAWCFFLLRTSRVTHSYTALFLLFSAQKKRGRPKKTADDGYDARLKTPKDVSARNKAGKEDKPRCVLHLTAKHAVSSDKHGVLGTDAPFLSRLLLVFPFPFPCPFPSFPQVSSLSSSSL